jgi:anion-transporting  ArsA/GET3 family ATPase
MGILTDQRLWIVSGKGGVGKSTVSAALALASARSGKRTLICEVNAQERISGLLERQPVGPEVRRLEDNLWAVNLQPEQALREYAVMVLKFEALYRAVFENRFVRYFLRFIPSIQELVLLGKILFHLREKLPDGRFKWDRIVMDAPATGHAISFLSVPQVILDTVPPGPLSKEAEEMRNLLVDPKVTAAVLVSLPEEMPLNETVELHQALSRNVRVKSAAAVLNMYIAPRFTAEELDEASPPVKPVVREHRLREVASAEATERLERDLRIPVVTVPRMFEARVTRATIEKVADHLLSLWGTA